jgi:CSLREA domain-containing protein
LFSCLVALLAAGDLLAAVGRPAAGATLTVNNTADATDAAPGDGVCETAAGNHICTLRAAVQESNALTGTDTIIVPAGFYLLTIAGQNEDAAASGDLDLRDDVTISGAGAAETIIDGNELERIFELHLAGTAVTISDLTIQNGSGVTGSGLRSYSGQSLSLVGVALNNNLAYPGLFGGGIYAGGLLTVSHSTFNGNGGSQGGAIFLAGGGATIENSHFISNTAGTGAAIYDFHTGLSNPTLVLSSTFIANEASVGAAIGVAPQAALNLVGSLLAENSVDVAGAAIYNTGHLTVSQSTIRDGRLTYELSITGGGGVYSSGAFWLLNSSVIDNTTLETSGRGGGLYLDGSAFLINSTISGNSSLNGGGLAIGTAVVAISNTTIASNTAVSEGGGLYDRPDYSGNVTLFNTIIAVNEGGNCLLNGDVASAGYNLDSGHSCGLAATGDLTNTNPLLGPLQDDGSNGTLYHPLLANSPAIDAAGNDGCPPTDQRGAPRPVDGDGDGDPICDIGAYEYSSEPPTPTPTPTPTATVTPTITPTPSATPPGVIDYDHYLPVIVHENLE